MYSHLVRFCLLVLVSFISNTVAFAQSGGNGLLRGDVNGDGEVGMSDVMYIVQYVLNGKFPDDGMTEFQKTAILSGYNSDVEDLSEEKSLSLDIPRCAIINITNDEGKASWPVTKVEDRKYYMEFWDMNGHYFKKEIIMNAQGNSSILFPKKNGTIDICNNNGWDDEDAFSLKFGNWVPQSSFHMKSYYLDYTRGAAVVGYQLADEVLKTRGVLRDRSWKLAVLNSGGTLSTSDLDAETDVRCMPDGFPVIVHMNGDFYGIYSWQLKKHRDNYHMDKKNTKHIHLDGEISAASMWGDSIDWNKFEVRNPKSLKDVNGEKYDGDNPKELAEGDVKDAIVRLSKSVREIDAAFKESVEAGKAKLEEYYDVDNLIDYLMGNMAIGNTDAYAKNWQWTTWDGKKWYANQYDLDECWGIHYSGTYISNPSILSGNYPGTPVYYIWNYYRQETKARWAELVSAGIFTIENVLGKLNDWMSRVGEMNYAKEWEKWQEAPCNRESGLDSKNWEFLGKYKARLEENDARWDNCKQYNVGDEVYFATDKDIRWLKVKAVKPNVNMPPYTIRYNELPHYGGGKDNKRRFEEWIEEHLRKQTEYFENLK